MIAKCKGKEFNQKGYEFKEGGMYQAVIKEGILYIYDENENELEVMCVGCDDFESDDIESVLTGGYYFEFVSSDDAGPKSKYNCWGRYLGNTLVLAVIGGIVTMGVVAHSIFSNKRKEQ